MAPLRAFLLSTRGLVLALLLLGGALTLANRSLPLVRNSLVYARASEHVIEHGYDPRPVVADSKLSYNKPILYAWFSAPFVHLFGNHDGLRLTSFLTTAAYLFALLHFARSFRALLPAGGELPFLLLSALGPCVAYQFWSAHPDGWFAALTVFVWSLTQRIATEPGHDLRRVLVLGLALLVAILLKNYGLVLLLTTPLQLLWYARALRADRERLRCLLYGLCGVFAVIGAFVVLAWKGANPFSRLEGEGGGVGQYGTGELWLSARGTWVQLGLALLLQLQLALPLVFRRSAWAKPLAAPLLCCAAPYVVGLMPFPTTFYNMRYFVPLFPIAALVVVRGLGTLAPAMRRGVLAAHGVAGLALVLVFNVAPLYRAAEPLLPRMEVNWIRVPLSLLDNLRMRQHLDQAAVLASIDRAVPAGATLYLLDVAYYGDAQHGVYERAGRIRPDIHTRYASSRGFHPDEPDCFVYSASRAPPDELGLVTDLGDGLYHVESGS